MILIGRSARHWPDRFHPLWLVGVLGVLSGPIWAADWQYDTVHGGLIGYATPGGDQVDLVRDGFGRYPVVVNDNSSGITWNYQDALDQQRAILTRSQGSAQTTIHYEVITADIYVLFDDNGQIDYNLGNLRFSIANAATSQWLSVTDYQGSTRTLVDQQQQVQTWFGYDALGKPTQQDGPACASGCPRGRAFDRRFQGQRYLAWDDTSSGYQAGFTDNRDRLYSHDQGLRFMHVDALGASISPYTAYGDDPINNTDPTGLMIEDVNLNQERRAPKAKPIRNLPEYEHVNLFSVLGISVGYGKQTREDERFQPISGYGEWNSTNIHRGNPAPNPGVGPIPQHYRNNLLATLHRVTRTGSRRGHITNAARERITSLTSDLTWEEFEEINYNAYRTVYGRAKSEQRTEKDWDLFGNLTEDEPFIVDLERVNKGLAIFDPNRHIYDAWPPGQQYHDRGYRQMLLPSQNNIQLTGRNLYRVGNFHDQFLYVQDLKHGGFWDEDVEVYLRGLGSHNLKELSVYSSSTHAPFNDILMEQEIMIILDERGESDLW